MLTLREEIYASAYYKTLGIKDPLRLKKIIDPTQSFILNKKGKRVGRFLDTRVLHTLNGQRIRYMWGGWRTRLDRVKSLVDRAHESAEKYSREILWPELKKHKGEKLYWWQKESPSDQEGSDMGHILYVEIDLKNNAKHKGKDDGWCYSNHNTSRVLSTGKVPHNAICQYPNWDIGDKVCRLIKLSSDKWSRHYTAKRYLDGLIAEKLKGIEDTYKPDSVIEFMVGTEKYRFVRRSHHVRNDYGLWDRVSADTPQNIDIHGILPKDFF